MTSPLRERKLDLAFVIWFCVNFFVVLLFDIEQVAVPGPLGPEVTDYPVWPPAPVVDAAHSYATQYDPLVAARPSWFVALIWIDIIFFAPFYAAASYAWTKGKSWIRVPSIMYATMMLTNVTLVLHAQAFGEYPSPSMATTLAIYGAYVVFPVLILWRTWPERPLFGGDG